MKVRRVYVDPSDFRAPFDSPNLTLTGLGRALGEALVGKWKPGRSYMNISNFRAPYDQYYFQDNSLFGLGEFLQSAQGEAAAVEATATAANTPASAPAPGSEVESKALGNTLAILGIGIAVGVAAGYGLWRNR